MDTTPQQFDRRAVLSALTYRFGVTPPALDRCLAAYGALPRWQQVQVVTLLCWPDDSFEARAREWIAVAASDKNRGKQ